MLAKANSRCLMFDSSYLPFPIFDPTTLEDHQAPFSKPQYHPHSPAQYGTFSGGCVFTMMVAGESAPKPLSKDTPVPGRTR